MCIRDRDYKEQIIYLQDKWADVQDTHNSKLFLTQITNCEAQIKHNETQYKQTIKQINELLQWQTNNNYQHLAI